MSLLETFKQEWGLYFYDKWLLASVTLVPIVLFVLASNIFGVSAVRDLPIGVVDFDNSSYSRELTRYFDASDKLYTTSYKSEKDALSALKNGKIYAYISIPYNMQSDVIKGLSPTIFSFYNTQFMLIGRSIDSSLKLVLENFNAKLSIGKALFKGKTKIKQAIEESVPFKQQITPLYNIGFNYSQFLLSIILPCVWQILMVSTIILNITSQQRKTGLKKWLEVGILKPFFAKLALHGAIMFFWCVGFIWYFYIYLGWEMNGSFTYLLFVGFLTITASQAVGFAIYFINYSPSRALSMAAAYTAPSLAFVGVTFPLSDMSPFAQVWSKLLPISHYLNVQISQANYGANMFNTFEDISILLVFNLLFVVAILSVRLKVLKESYELS